MTPRATVAVALLALFALGGCSRHVVMDPDRVHRHNDREWSLKSAPGSVQPGAVALPPSSPSGIPTAPPSPAPAPRAPAPR